MAHKLHLYLTPGSCALAAHIALEEADLAYSTTSVPLRDGFPPKYLHLNPKGRVPFLDFDGEIITENLAVINMIAALAPTKNLLGKTILENARAQEWLSWLSGTMHSQAFGMLFRPGWFVDDEQLFSTVRAKGTAAVKRCFEYVEGRLEGRKYAVGEDFTAIDGYLLVFYRWGNASEFPMKEDFPNYTRLAQEVVKRGAVKKALEDEGLDPLKD